MGAPSARRWALVALVGAGLALLAVASARGLYLDLERPRDLSQVEHATSASCVNCHPTHHESWARTFHRTMTQEADAESVLGDFDGATLRYGDVTARFSRGEDGAHFVDFERAGAPLGRARVERTVGSRRVQQLLASEEDLYIRLPVAWHIEEARWIHMNGAFLTPDPVEVAEGGSLTREDYERHVVRWNDNCIFCHNVRPNPGHDPERDVFRSSVAELGIACEACHGPAEEHVRLNRNPLRRYALRSLDRQDPTIVHPARLSAERSNEVCGRCHGQRSTADVSPFLRRGDRFVPGEDLSRYSEPLTRTSTLHGERAFEARFWPDGTARLTAYEYQGLLQSPCDELRCTSCHGMHEGDPRGQLRPEASGDGACVGCHSAFAAEDAAREHAHHLDVRCVDCHMPRVVYGLIDVHRSHRIESPDPARDAAAGRPDACTLCHTGASPAWAAAAHAGFWGDGAGRLSPDAEPPALVVDLLGGDPIERAVAASALGRLSEATPSDLPRAERLGLLFHVMQEDPYPAVRWIAWRSARAIAPELPIDPFEATGSARERRLALEPAQRELGSGRRPPDPGLVTRLAERRSAVAIEIGE